MKYETSRLFYRLRLFFYFPLEFDSRLSPDEPIENYYLSITEVPALRINNLMPAKKLQTIQQLQTQLTQLQLRNNSLLIKSEERECENILEL
ncbi:hypothetical protein RIR_jg34928.t1 [Rhizophagus irregularis DAOM 181602=DAOM 197198]|nr:hypothetical protein RIR_jg34928.t1 [Rhizophagus irregularis DAOM 181602=DAOM 197198]CAB4490461.1 unnamed protein product [Rhizophagus irregularis]